MNERQTFDDQVFLRGPRQSKRDVRLASRQIDVEIGALKLELNLRVALAESAEVRRDETGGEHLGRGEPDDALELLIFTGDVSLDAERFPLDPFGARQQPVPRLGEDIPGRRAIEQTGPEALPRA